MDDISPFYDQFTKRLYFSSNGYPSLGGFDIFYTAQDSLSQWRTPQNLMRPLNSQADDVFFRKAQGESLLDESEKGQRFSNTAHRMMIYSFLMYLLLILKALFQRIGRMEVFHWKRARLL